MRTRPDHWYRQSAAVPVRERNGELEILLVTSLKNSRWILPKGIVEPGMTPQESAAKEAWEEAGVKGRIAETPLGHYVNRKWGGLCRVDAYRLDVTEIAGDWLESGKRERRWFSVREAARQMKSDEAAAMVKKLGELKHTLILLRHAKASRDDPKLADFDRPLTGRGKRDAPLIGQRMMDAGVRPELILSSPARRAIKTARLVAKALGVPKSAIVEAPEIYEAEVPTLTALVRELPPGRRRVMIVGHNPGLSDLMRTILKVPADDLPTAGVTAVELEIPDWKAIEPGLGKLAYRDFPKNPAFAPEADADGKSKSGAGKTEPRQNPRSAAGRKGVLI